MKSKKIQIDQMLPSYSMYDAVGTEVRLLKNLIEEMGHSSTIYYEHKNQSTSDHSVDIKKLNIKKYSPSLVIYHYSTGSSLVNLLYDRHFPTINRFHNITPQEFFHQDYETSYRVCCDQGYAEMPMVKSFSHESWAASQFNAKVLDLAGFSNIKTVPVLRHYDNLLKQPSHISLEKMMRDGKKNILFVGRVAPNKAPHDLLILQKILREVFPDIKTRLIIAGHLNMPYVPLMLKPFSETLNLKIEWQLPQHEENFKRADIIFTDVINDELLATLYRNTDLFLCLSEHEGFCVPLIEAMGFGVPIIAHSQAAIPETIGSGGILIDKTNWPETLKQVVEVLTSKEKSQELRTKAKKRAEDFSFTQIKKEFQDLILAKLNSLNS